MLVSSTSRSIAKRRSSTYGAPNISPTAARIVAPSRRSCGRERVGDLGVRAGCHPQLRCGPVVRLLVSSPTSTRRRDRFAADLPDRPGHGLAPPGAVSPGPADRRGGSAAATSSRSRDGNWCSSRPRRHAGGGLDGQRSWPRRSRARRVDRRPRRASAGARRALATGPTRRRAPDRGRLTVRPARRRTSAGAGQLGGEDGLRRIRVAACRRARRDADGPRPCSTPVTSGVRDLGGTLAGTAGGRPVAPGRRSPPPSPLRPARRSSAPAGPSADRPGAVHHSGGDRRVGPPTT